MGKSTFKGNMYSVPSAHVIKMLTRRGKGAHCCVGRSKAYEGFVVRKDCDWCVTQAPNTIGHRQSPATMDRSIPCIALSKSAIEVFTSSQSVFLLDWFLEAEKHIANQYSVALRASLLTSDLRQCFYFQDSFPRLSLSRGVTAARHLIPAFT